MTRGMVSGEDGKRCLGMRVIGGGVGECVCCNF